MNRPFDAVRYAGLLEGLEISVVQKRNLNDELRYEAEYFRKRFLHEDSALSRLPQKTLGEFAHVTDGPHGYHVVDEASPVVMLTAKNAKDWFTERAGADSIATWVDDANKRSSLGVDDIILSTRGTVGLCALVTEEVLPANIDQDVARISWKDRDSFPPGFIVAYLNSSYGQDHFARYSSGMVQQGMSLSKVREIPIPLLSKEISVAIAGMVQSALDSRRSAAADKIEAEQTLLRALGLENWHPPEPLSYVRSSRDAFAAGRLDTAHFAPTASLLENKIKQTKSWVLLGDLLMLNLRGSQPAYAETGTPVVNSKHVVNGEVRIDDDNRCGLCSDDQAAVIRPGDVLINGTGVGTIGRAAPYLHGHIALPDNHVTILRPKPKAIDPIYLAIFLNSLAGQLQVSKWLRGSSGQIELYPSDIAQFIVWLAPEAIQQSIRKAVEAAAANNRRAADLLDAAKRAVELAIEESEAVALQYLASFDALTTTAP